MELSIRKLHLVNDLMFTGLRRVVDSFDPYNWIIVCTICTIDYVIRKLHSLTAKSENSRHNTWPIQVWVSPKHEGRWNQTKHWNHANIVKYDYASFFERVTPKHSLLARYKNKTYDSETYAFMKQTGHRAKKPCKYDYTSFFIKRSFWLGANSLHPVFTTNKHVLK